MFFMDSTIVLAWIRSASWSFKPFVSSRVREIQSNSDPIQWRHIPGEFNVADDVSRGDTCAGFKQEMVQWTRVSPTTRLRMASGKSSSKFKRRGDGISPREDCWYSDHSQQWRNNSPPEIFQLEKADQSNCTYPKTGLEDLSKTQWRTTAIWSSYPQWITRGWSSMACRGTEEPTQTNAEERIWHSQPFHRQ